MKAFFLTAFHFLKPGRYVRMPLVVLERKILGISITLLFIWITLLFILSVFIGISSSLNVQRVILTSLTSMAVVVGIAALEYFKPWWGFYLFLMFWPIMSVVQELLTRWDTLLLDLRGWSLTAALAFGCWLRFKQSSSNSCAVAPITVPRRGHHGWLLAFRLALWGLVLSYFFSSLVSTWRMQHPPPDWIIWQGGKLVPLGTALVYLPSLLLGLLLLNQLATNAFASTGLIKKNSTVPSLPLLPSGKMIAFAVTGGIFAASFFIYQIKTGFTWSFNSGVPQAGVFFNQNTMAPFLAIIGILLFAAARPPKSKQVALCLLGCVFLFLTFLTHSRNGVFMILCSIMALLLIRINWRRFLLIVAVLTLFLAFLFYLPLPKLEVVSLKRFFQTVEALRAGELGNALLVRWELFKAAILIFLDYPWLGSGPGTFPMLTANGARFGNIVGSYQRVSPHSMPLHLLAENGLLGMMSWSVAWLLLPLIAVIRWRSEGALALVVLVMGVGNLFDTVWMVPGMTTFCVLLIVWAYDSSQDRRDACPDAVP